MSNSDQIIKATKGDFISKHVYGIKEELMQRLSEITPFSESVLRHLISNDMETIIEAIYVSQSIGLPLSECCSVIYMDKFGE